MLTGILSVRAISAGSRSSWYLSSTTARAAGASSCTRVRSRRSRIGSDSADSLAPASASAGAALSQAGARRTLAADGLDGGARHHARQESLAGIDRRERVPQAPFELLPIFAHVSASVLSLMRSI